MNGCAVVEKQHGFSSVVERFASEKHVLKWKFKLYDALMLAVQVLCLAAYSRGRVLMKCNSYEEKNQYGL